jgi:hypothetical protein
MIKSKFKRRAKSISSRKKNVRDKTITYHCLWHSEATEKEWFWFFVYDDVYLHSSSSDHFVTLHLLLTTSWLHLLWSLSHLITISRDDIDFLSFAFVKIVILFHDSSKFNYQTKTLYMFWLISIDVIFSNLKKIILTNSLINISRLKNKFISMNLHLKLHNEYMKKIIRDKRISFLNLEYLFEYIVKLTSTIKRQFIWMKHFHHVFTNIRHATID